MNQFLQSNQQYHLLHLWNTLPKDEEQYSMSFHENREKIQKEKVKNFELTTTLSFGMKVLLKLLQKREN